MSEEEKKPEDIQEQEQVQEVEQVKEESAPEEKADQGEKPAESQDKKEKPAEDIPATGPAARAAHRRRAQGNRGGRGRRDQKDNKQQKNQNDADAPEVVEKVISINRITKVTKGGKKLSFRALVVVGDSMGKVGYSCSKAGEVSVAIRKALTTAKRNMIRISLNGSTIAHEIIGECAGAEVLLKPASEGTGVIASGPVRAVCDGAGIHNILTKCHRSNNPINVVKATFDGLTRLKATKKKLPETIEAGKE